METSFGGRRILLLILSQPVATNASRRDTKFSHYLDELIL
uniref:Uncharacterized protein n=1 Tax=Lepeophtheirus salmonis TaxID=72036 RepID=A0A0K2V3K8_LEPSM